jgi:hypothetical protein
MQRVPDGHEVSIQVISPARDDVASPEHMDLLSLNDPSIVEHHSSKTSEWVSDFKAIDQAVMPKLGFGMYSMLLERR